MLDQHDKRPLYIQLVDTLQRQIEEDYHPDDQLPTEKELCEEYSVSRTTVRLAMTELERRGSIYRIQGKGSFVSSDVPSALNTLLGFDFGSHFDGYGDDGSETRLTDVSPSVSAMSLLQLFGTQRRDHVMAVGQEYYFKRKLVAKECLYINTHRVPMGTIDSSRELTKVLLGIKQSIGSVREQYQADTLPASLVDGADVSSRPILLVNKYVYGKGGELLVLSERQVFTDVMPYQSFLFTALE